MRTIDKIICWVRNIRYLVDICSPFVVCHLCSALRFNAETNNNQIWYMVIFGHILGINIELDL